MAARRVLSIKNQSNLAGGESFDISNPIIAGHVDLLPMSLV